MPVDLSKYKEEVEGGLSNESKVMDEALERQDFYDYCGKKYQKYFRRDAESWQDYAERSHRMSGFLRECISKLTAHLYTPGPTRTWNVDAGNEFLQQVYRDNFIDSLMLEADRLSTLNAVVAIQIDTGSEIDEDGTAYSNPDTRPITYRIWGREHFAAFTSPEDDRVVEAVVTKDMYDEQTRYRLWSDTEVWTFLTKKESPSVGGGKPTAGGRVATLTKQETHDYQCLPFSFIHYELPIKCFDVVAPGEFLTRAEIAIDNRLMKLDESIDGHLFPVPVVEGVDEHWKFILGPSRAVRMPLANPTMTSAGYVPGDHARLYYLERHVESDGAWNDLQNYIDQALDAVGIPKSAVRMEQMSVASGISLMVEQEPLLKRAETRRSAFKVYERDLAYRTLWCAGNHYGKPELVSAAEKGDQMLGWPRPRLAVITPDVIEMGLQEVSGGLKSHLMLVQDMYGMRRDEALEFIEQIKEDTEEVRKLFPEAAAATGPVDPEAEAKAAEQQHQFALEQIEAKKGEA